MDSSDLYLKAKLGCIAGLVGGFALFSSFFWIDSEIDVPFGTFYKTVGLMAGLDGMSAMAFGFFAHMLIAALVGAVFCTVSVTHRFLHISSVPKGIVGGTVTGMQVYAIFFLPLTIFVMLPAVSDQALGVVPVTQENMRIAGVLMDASDKILWGALVLHVLFGAVMGLFSAMMLYEEYNMKGKEKKEKKESWKKLERERWPDT